MKTENRFRVGIYIDGYNLYYGGKTLFPRGNWKWLDVRKLVCSQFPRHEPWGDAEVKRVLYFTSEVTNSPETLRRQQAYLEALRIHDSVDYIVYGKFKSFKDENYAVTGHYTKFKKVSMAIDPLPNEDWVQLDSENFIKVSHQRNEEKGSDVNLASHLLIDLLTDQLDAAVVVSNDADLAYPISYARTRIPVGVINPRGGKTAGDLKGSPSDGVGDHWWYSLKAEDFLAAQLPDNVEGVTRPETWN